MPVSCRSEPPILVIVRESPLRQRTAALLQSVAAQEPSGLAEAVVLSVRRPESAGGGARAPGVRELMAEADWLQQALRLVEESRCRWVVVPSSVDRYLPGAFETVMKVGTAGDEAVVLGCRVRQEGRDYRIGPNPFRFDYFALFSGFNYLAPGAVFLSATRLKADGGFDPRFPNAAAYEYLLRTGAAHRIASCDGPFLETEACPFPGIPPEYATLYATEALLVTLSYNRFSLTPGAALGLVGVVAQGLQAARYAGHDQRLATLLAGAGSSLIARYLERVGLEEERGGPAERRGATIWTTETQASSHPQDHRLRARLRAVTPGPVWNTLRRARRAWQAFGASLD
jgi:hypothetical protein